MTAVPGEEGDWPSHGEALRAALSAVRPVGTETIAPDRAGGRVLAAEVRAEARNPPWDSAAMDGYAVRERDLEGAAPGSPVTLPVSGELPAGSLPGPPLEPGTAVRVATGAPVPEGATGVVRREHTDGGTDRVTIHRASDADRNIRVAGEELEAGQTVLRAGSEVTPAASGLLAAAGSGPVEVYRRPRVGILSTGDELAGPEELESVRAGRGLADANGPALVRCVEREGAEAVPLGIAPDDRDEVRRRLDGADRLDAVLSTGGVSVGERDHVRAALEETGAERLFWRARIRPGSPLAFWRLPSGRPAWTLPGNPVSALVVFEVLVRPALRKLAGHGALTRRRVPVRTGEALSCRPGLTYFYRVRLLGNGSEEGPPRAELAGPQGSARLTTLVAADALMVVPEGAEEVAEGTRLEAIPLRGWRRG